MSNTQTIFPSTSSTSRRRSGGNGDDDGDGNGSNPPSQNNSRNNSPNRNNRNPSPDRTNEERLTRTLNQLATAIGNMNGNQRELNIVHVPKFFGYANEDSEEWVEAFEKAASANKWREVGGRKSALAASFLDGPAYQWYLQDRPNIGPWYQQGALNNFRDRFLLKYTTTALLNKWQMDYRNCKQDLTEPVDEYNNRFIKAMIRADKVGNTPAPIRVMHYFSGLKINLAQLVTVSGPVDVYQAMDIAKQIEGITVINRAEIETHYLEVYNQITQELHKVKK